MPSPSRSGYSTSGAEEVRLYAASAQRPVGRSTSSTQPQFASARKSDAESVGQVFDLVRDEGLVMGGSTGVNVAGAVRMARELGPGHTIVTVLCDYGNRYASKLFNPEFLRSKHLPVPDWLADGAEIAIPYEKVA